MTENEPHKLDDEELNDLAKRIVLNEVYITNTPDGLQDSFGALLAFSRLEKRYIEKMGAVYEEFSKANEMSVNGKPTFFSCKILHIDQLTKLLELVDEKRKIIQAL